MNERVYDMCGDYERRFAAWMRDFNSRVEVSYENIFLESLHYVIMSLCHYLLTGCHSRNEFGKVSRACATGGHSVSKILRVRKAIQDICSR